jgi:hypothetical protein
MKSTGIGLPFDCHHLIARMGSAGRFTTPGTVAGAMLMMSGLCG